MKVLKKEELRSEVAIIVGTRPGIIKFSSVIRALEKSGVPFFIVHTGQHYSFNMDRQFFDDLNLPEPRYTNDTVRKEVFHGAQTGEMLKGIEASLIDSKPRLVIVGGDANTNLAGALAARKLGLTLVHMEAGLRSHDWRMPEEHNRVMIDHISDVLLAPTVGAKQNLLEDNVKGEIHVVGNPIVDAVFQNVEIAESKSDIMSRLNLESKGYMLVTIHREENVDDENTLRRLIRNIEEATSECRTQAIFPIHPRTKKQLKRYGLWKAVSGFDKCKIIEALGYLDFLMLLKNALLVLTDSGGIQEEACIIRVPCITLRENTERPETVEVGANCIVGADTHCMIKAIRKWKGAKCDWINPFGDGRTGERIGAISQRKLEV